MARFINFDDDVNFGKENEIVQEEKIEENKEVIEEVEQKSAEEIALEEQFLKQLREAEEQKQAKLEEQRQKEALEKQKEIEEKNLFWWNQTEEEIDEDLGVYDFIWWFEEEDEVKKLFLKKLDEHRKSFKEWMKWINFSYQVLDHLVVESLAISELSSDEKFYDDTEKLRRVHSNRKIIVVNEWETIYDYLWSIKWNTVTYVEKKDFVHKDCPVCYWDGKVTCPTCRWEKNLRCRICHWDWTIQQKKLEKKIVDKWPCPICWGSKNRVCGNCQWQWILNQQCWNCRGLWRMPDGNMCNVCNGNGTTKAPCIQCKGWGKIRCNECNEQWRVLVSETVELFETVKCLECNGKWHTTCGKCYGEWELMCENCDGEWKVYSVREYTKEFEVEKQKEFFGKDVEILWEDESIVGDFKWTKIKLPLSDTLIEFYLPNPSDKWRFNRFVENYKNNVSKKKTIFWKQLKYIIWRYSYQDKIYKLYIYWWKVVKMELPESSTTKFIKWIVEKWFIAKWVFGNLFKKKDALQKDLEDFD